MGRIRILDVSELEPCEPLERTLAAIETLSLGECLRVLHRRDPLPLYEILEKRGFAHQTLVEGETAFEIWIWQQGDDQARQLIPPPQ